VRAATLCSVMITLYILMGVCACVCEWSAVRGSGLLYSRTRSRVSDSSDHQPSRPHSQLLLLGMCASHDDF